MSLLSKLPLRISLPLVIAVSGGVSLGALAYSELRATHDDLDQRTHSQAQFTAHLVSALLEEALGAGDYPRVRRILQPIMADRQATSGVVVDERNTPIIDLVTHTPDETLSLDSIKDLLAQARLEHSVQTRKLIEEDTLVSVAPLAVGPGAWHAENPYLLIVTYNIAPRRAAAELLALQRTLRRAAALALIVLLTWLLLDRIVVVRIGRLILLTKAISQGRFDNLKPLSGGDELALLSQALTRMSEKLHAMHSKLSDNEAHYRLLVEQSNDIILIVTATGVIDYVSPAVERVLNSRPVEVLEQRLLDFVHPDDQSDARETFRLAQTAPDRRLSIELRVLSKSGDWQHLECCCHILPGATGTAPLLITARDINERRLAETRLRASETLNRSLVENSPYALIMYNPTKDHVELANPEAKRILGRSPLGMTAEDLFLHSSETQANDTKVADFGREQMQRALSKHTQFSWEFRQSNGKTIPCHTQMVPIRQGKETLLLWAIIDYSAQQRLETKLQTNEGRLETLLQAIPESVSILSAKAEVLNVTHCATDNNPVANELNTIELDGPELSVLTKACELCATHKKIQRLRLGTVATKLPDSDSDGNTQTEPTQKPEQYIEYWHIRLIPYSWGSEDAVLCISSNPNKLESNYSALRTELREMQENYQHSPALLVHTDKTGKITSINEQGANRLGYKADELNDKPLDIIFYGGDSEVTLTSRPGIPQGRSTQGGYVVFRHANGDPISAACLWSYVSQDGDWSTDRSMEIAALLPEDFDLAAIAA